MLDGMGFLSRLRGFEGAELVRSIVVGSEQGTLYVVRDEFRFAFDE